MLRRLPAFALALAALGLAGCDEKIEPGNPSPAVRAPPAPRRDFGGGYRDAKWGMTPAEVGKVLGAPAQSGPAPDETDLERQLFKVKDDAGAETKKTVEAYFLDGRLMRAVLVPHFGGENAQGYENTLKVLSDKYGPGQARRGLVDPRTRAHVDLVGWTDGQTLVQLRIDRLAPDEAERQKKADGRLFATTQIIYTSVPVATARGQRQAAAALSDGGQPAAPPPVAPASPAATP